jgi:hypothetical protein
MITLKDIFRLISEDYSQVRKMTDDELYYDRMDFIRSHSQDDTDLDIDIHSLQIMIEQIRRWDGIVKIVGLLPHQNNLIKEK